MYSGRVIYALVYILPVVGGSIMTRSKQTPAVIENLLPW